MRPLIGRNFEVERGTDSRVDGVWVNLSLKTIKLMSKSSDQSRIVPSTAVTVILEFDIPQRVIPAATAAGLPQSSLPALLQGITLGDFSTVPGIAADIVAANGAAVQEAYTLTFRTLYLCTLPFGALLISAALFSPNVEQYLTDEVARKMHGRNEKTEFDHKEIMEA